MSKSRTRIVAVTAAGTGLAAGLALGVTGLASASTPSPAAASPAASAQGHGHHGKHHGKHHGHDGQAQGDLVTAVTGTTISLDTPRGPKTVSVTPTTTYQRDGKAASLAEVSKGEILRVRLVDPTAAVGVAKTVRIELARAAGYVTSISGQSFTLVGPDGFTRTVHQGAATTYRNSGTTGAATEVAVGKFLRATGTVDPDGTSLDAARISTGPDRHKDTGADADAMNH